MAYLLYLDSAHYYILRNVAMIAHKPQFQNKNLLIFRYVKMALHEAFYLVGFAVDLFYLQPHTRCHPLRQMIRIH